MTIRLVRALLLLVVALTLAPSGAASTRHAGVSLPLAGVPLTVEVVAGTGKVTSEPAGIDCGTTCTAYYASGSHITLTADPGQGASLHAWGGACSGTTPTCVVTLTDAATVTSAFDPVKLTVTAQGSGGWVTSSGEDSQDGIDCGVGSTCTASFPIGTSLTLYAIRTKEGALESWSGCTSASSVLCGITLTADTSITAVFSKLALQIPVSVETDVEVSRSGAGDGEIGVTPPGGQRCASHCIERYPVGVRLHLTASPAASSTFGGWTGGCGGAGGPTCTVGVVPGLTVGAVFEAAPSLGAGTGGGGSSGGGSDGGGSSGGGSGGSGSGGGLGSGAGSGPGTGTTASHPSATRIALQFHVRSLGVPGGRKLSLLLETSRSAVARIVVRDPGGAQLRRDAAIANGHNVIVVPVPSRRPTGRQRVTIVLRDVDGQTETLAAKVRLR